MRERSARGSYVLFLSVCAIVVAGAFFIDWMGKGQRDRVPDEDTVNAEMSALIGQAHSGAELDGGRVSTNSGMPSEQAGNLPPAKEAQAGIPAGSAAVPAKDGAAKEAEAAPATQGKLDLNRATAEQLDGLPGIGETKAKAIVEYRKTNGPFRKAEDLMKVKGIGTKTYEKLKDLITVGADPAAP